MPRKNKAVGMLEPVEPLIREVRGERVILDSDLARVYCVPTFRFNEAVKRNGDRFPEDFRFQLTPGEAESVRSQIAILKSGRGQHRKLILNALKQLEDTTGWAYPESRRLIGFRPGKSSAEGRK